MALGKALKQARMRKKLTASEVAADTRMKVQTVTELEEEDFSKIAAPVYAKGFIKLYAEYVGLDAHALIQEYVERFVETQPSPPVVDVEEPVLPVAEPEPVEEPAPSPAALSLEDEPDLFAEIEPASQDRRGILMDEGYRETESPLRERPGTMITDAVDAVHHAGDRAGEACRDSCRGCVRGVVAGWKRLVETVVARRRELTQIDFKNLSAKHMMAFLGVLVLVLLVISSLSRCVSGREYGTGPSGIAPAQTPIAADPVDVYLD